VELASLQLTAPSHGPEVEFVRSKGQELLRYGDRRPPMRKGRCSPPRMEGWRKGANGWTPGNKDQGRVTSSH